MKTLFLVTLFFVAGCAHAMTPPTQYICNPDKLGNCICRQNETTAFPQIVKPLFLCDKSKVMILHGDMVTVRPSDGRTSVSYTIYADRTKMLVQSLKGLMPVVNRYWSKDDSVWRCQDAGLCQVNQK